MTDTPSTRPFRFGVIADPQYADVPPSREHDRFYANSLDKIAEALDVFRRQAVDLVVVLGDLIDHDFRHFEPIMGALADLPMPLVMLPGNHDFDVATDERCRVRDMLGMPAAYYQQSFGGIRFIVLDTTEIALFSSNPGDPRHDEAMAMLDALKAKGAPNARDWNAGMSAAQIAWLEEVLRQAEAAGERAILLGHYPLHPLTDHGLWNADAVSQVIARSPAAIAYFCGHDHRGNYGRKGGTHFLNMKGMVDTERTNAFAVVTVEDHYIEIEGFGREASRTLRY